MSKRKDILDELSKDELLAWVRTQFFCRLPTRSEILYLRWEKQSAEVLEEMRIENLKGAGVDIKERDRLAVRFNESTDSAEKLRLLELMEPYHAALQAHIKRSQAIDRKLKRVDALYEQIDIERRKEGAYSAS
ncbi:hypothetical protein D9N00_19195 [Pseudomonas syringae pv. actinidiae]|uniref:hypothetical protein n=1 Tax=Pseudomonas syringae TaxID=317 RepID=UPI000EF1324D|nr:hypothetical protein [Pseudomonas syringae]AYL18814.1 hypothetical protein D9N00_19195 [Pseudomonas syringae pv. actinidiae]